MRHSAAEITASTDALSVVPAFLIFFTAWQPIAA
jgi:hypothetical protein